MRKVVSRDGTTIAYEKSGSGPPIVVLGGGFRDHRTFDSLLPELTPHCTVYAYDRRGRGESGDAPVYAIEREIEDLHAVIDAAGGEATVFGGSSGGILALEAALAGVPITRLALLEPPYRVEGFWRPPEDFAARLQSLLDEEKRSEAAEYYLSALIGLPPDVVADWRQGPMWSRNVALAHTLPYDTALMGDDRVPVERLADVKVHTLLINSDSTADWLHAAARATADALPDCQRLELPGVWHRVLPDVLGPVLVDFVNGRKPAAPSAAA